MPGCPKLDQTRPNGSALSHDVLSRKSILSFAIDWKENCNNRTIIPGLGIYFLDTSEGNWNIDEIKRQMYVTRSHGMGYAFFRNKFFYDNTKGLYSFTKDEFNLYPALTPPMEWAKAPVPQSPQNLSVKVTDKNEL